MARRISQQGVARQTRTERLRQRFAEQRVQQDSPQAQQQRAIETQKQDVDLKISQEQQRLQELDKERINLINAGEGLSRRQGINRDYQTKFESAKARIRALQDIKRELNKGEGTFEESFVESYVSSYQSIHDSDRISSMRNAERRRKAVKEQEAQKELQEKLKTATPEQIQMVETSKDGKSLKRDYYFIEDGKYSLIGEKKAMPYKNLAMFEQLPETRIKNTLAIGGKKYVFESTERLYVTPKGSTVVTAFENIGTPKEIEKQLKESRDKYDTEMTLKAQKILSEHDFAEGDYTIPKQSTWGKVWRGARALKFASIFGTGTSTTESTQREMTNLREDRIRSLQFLYKPWEFGSIPVSEAWDTLGEQRELDIKGDKFSTDLEKLDTILKDVEDKELKGWVGYEGLSMLGEKGLEIRKFKNYENALKSDKYGTMPEPSKEIEITDEAFDRRISQNLLEWEDTKKTKTWVDDALLGTRALSSKGVETYLMVKGLGYAIKGGVVGYKLLGGGLGTIETMTSTGWRTADAITVSKTSLKAVQMAEGVAYVPKTYGGLKALATVGIAGGYSYLKVKQYQTYAKTSEHGKSLFWLETAGELAGIELATGIGSKTFAKAQNRIENWSLKTVKQADISQKGFLRENKLLGGKERVFMERYKGFKIKSPKTWLQTLKGYEKGQFTGRSYKFLPDEVVAHYQYGGDVPIYSSKTGKLLKIVKAEPFPFDSPKTHMDWFMRKNIAEYPVPRKSKLPISVKNKAFGYSATGEEWKLQDFNPSKIYYYEGGKLKFLNVKGAVKYVSGKGVSGGFLRIFKHGGYESVVGKQATKPIIYADYIKHAQLNKVLKEIRGIEAGTGRELKAYLFKHKTGGTGVLNIGGFKREVEGVVEISKRIPIRRAYAIKLEGWKVPIEEQIFGSKAGLSSVELKNIIKSMGKVTEFSGMAYSSLPSKTSMFSPAFSIVGYSSPKKSYKGYSVASKTSSPVFSSKPYSPTSSISKIVSKISRVSNSPVSRSSFSSSIVSTPLSSSSSIASSIMAGTYLKGLLRMKKKKKKRGKELSFAPTFTEKALGIKPIKIGAKDVEKLLSKKFTGFELFPVVRVR